MMLTVNAEEFRSLSGSCQRELLALLLGEDRFESVLKGTATNPSPESELEEPPDSESSVDDVVGTTRAVDLTPDQARGLVTRLADESINTLKLFASGNPVAISELLNSNPTSYKRVSDLNRKFVGAINRALRTVMQVKGKAKDRSSVLLVPVKDYSEASDLLEKRIKVTPLTAVALRETFQLTEPLPTPSFSRLEGDTFIPLNEQTESTLLLASLIGKYWNNFDGRPGLRRYSVSAWQIVEHFNKSGLKTFRGEHCGFVGGTEDYPGDSLYKLAELHLPGDIEGKELREFMRGFDFDSLLVSHERAPGVVACFENLDWY